MPYASWSVIAGEQPLATKWNILGTNDADFDDRLTDLESTPITTEASSSTPTPVGSAVENQYQLTALATAPTFAEPSGTPVNGNSLTIRIKDNGTARALSFNAIYRFSDDLPAPTTTTINKTMYLGFKYNSADSKWDCVGIVDNF